MPAGTALTPGDRSRGNFQQFSFALTPGLIGAAGTEVETIAIPGCVVTDTVVVCAPSAGFAAGIVMGHGRVSAPGTVTFNLFNITAGALTPAAGTFLVTLFRGSTMAFAR